MEKDFLYTNAPLVEVIAEIHWKLRPILGTPNAAIDPHFSVFVESFIENCKQIGFESVEKIIPDEIPQEFIPNKPIFRIRKNAEEWPLYQIGPGILAVNIVPPYDGWGQFAPFIHQGIELLFESYPVPDKSLKLSKLELRYIDAFTSAHGLEKIGQFVREELKLAPSLPNRLNDYISGSTDDIEHIGRIRIKLREPIDTVGVIAVDTGTSNNKEAVITTFVSQSLEQGTPQDISSMRQWFDQSHKVIKDWFDIMISDKIRALLGPKKSI